MRKRTALLSRLERLERQQVGKRRWPRVVFAIYGSPDEAIIGYADRGDASVLRLDNETAEGCARRAFALQPGAVTIAAIYGPHPDVDPLGCV